MPLDVTRHRLVRRTRPLVFAWQAASFVLCLPLWVGGWWAFASALVQWCLDVAATLDLARGYRTLVDWRVPFALSPVHTLLKYVVAGTSPCLPAVRPYFRLGMALYLSVATIAYIEQFLALRSRR